MYRFCFLIFWVSFFLASCGSREEIFYTGIPEDSIIPREQMIKMLADVHIIEASLQAERNKGNEPTRLSVEYYKTLFSKNGVSERRFKGSMNYYKHDQANFIKMYEEVIEILKKQAAGNKAGPVKDTPIE